MDVTIRVDGAASAVDELLRLWTWIDEDVELRGRSRMVVASPETGELGGLPRPWSSPSRRVCPRLSPVW